MKAGVVFAIGKETNFAESFHGFHLGRSVECIAVVDVDRDMTAGQQELCLNSIALMKENVSFGSDPFSGLSSCWCATNRSLSHFLKACSCDSSPHIASWLLSAIHPIA